MVLLVVSIGLSFGIIFPLSFAEALLCMSMGGSLV